MKKIYLLFAAALFSFNMMAQKSNIVVFSEDGESFYAFLNGVKQNATAQPNVKITDIPGDMASLRIVFANSGTEPIKKNFPLDPAGMEHTVKLKRDKKGGIKMQYFGSIALNESTSTAPAVAYTPTDATTTNTGTNTNTNTATNTNTGTSSTNTTTSPVVNETYNTNTQVNDPNMNGTVTTTTTTTNTQNTGNTGGENINMTVGMGTNGFNMNVNVSGSGTGENVNMNTGMNTNGSENVNMNTGVNGSENVNMNVNMNGMGTGSTSTTSTSSTTYSSSSTGTTNVDNSGYNTTGTTSNNYNTTTTTPAPAGCAFATDETSFQKMKKAVEGATFSDTKMSTAKTATKNNCLSTDQVKVIMGLFNMDDDKLAYAKFAYDYTVDKNNFYQLGEAFAHSISKDELNTFIDSK